MKLSTEQLKRFSLPTQEKAVEIKPIKRSDVCKDYLHDFLAWVYSQNEDFNETIEPEELINYFLKEFHHPIWFRAYLKKDKFNNTVRVSSYIHKHMSGAYIYQQKMKISPKLDAVYTTQVFDNTLPKATKQQLQKIINLAKEVRFKLEPFELEGLTAQEANYNIHFLNDLKKEPKE